LIPQLHGAKPQCEAQLLLWGNQAFGIQCRDRRGRSGISDIGAENVAERVFEEVSVSRFPFEHEDLTDIASKLEALGDDLSEAAFKKFFESKDDWSE
jgi:hypothetical protein